MTLALADFRTAILALLDDPGLARYTNASVDEALRWAIVEYAAAGNANYDIKDLDGAVTTTLPAADSVNVEVGTAGYCALIRSISRTETINLNQAVADNLRKTADRYLTEFYRVLGVYSSGYAEKKAYQILTAASATDAAAATTARDTALEADREALLKLKFKNSGAADKALLVIAGQFKAAFEAGLERAARRKPAVGEPDTRAWNDVWHDAWGQ